MRTFDVRALSGHTSHARAFAQLAGVATFMHAALRLSAMRARVYACKHTAHTHTRYAKRQASAHAGGEVRNLSKEISIKLCFVGLSVCVRARIRVSVHTNMLTRNRHSVIDQSSRRYLSFVLWVRENRKTCGASATSRLRAEMRISIIQISCTYSTHLCGCVQANVVATNLDGGQTARRPSNMQMGYL